MKRTTKDYFTTCKYSLYALF